MPLSMGNVKKSGTECKMHCHSWLFLYISYDLFLSQQCRFQLNGQGERFKGRQIWQNMPLDERSPLVSLLALFKKFVPDNKKIQSIWACSPFLLVARFPSFSQKFQFRKLHQVCMCICIFCEFCTQIVIFSFFIKFFF